MTTKFEIGLDTPVAMLTIGQLIEIQRQFIEEQVASMTSNKTEGNELPKYVNSMTALAEILGCSASTLYRMKADGKFDGCISQCGKWQMIDVPAIIEKYKTNKNTTKTKRKWTI